MKDSTHFALATLVLFACYVAGGIVTGTFLPTANVVTFFASLGGIILGIFATFLRIGEILSGD